MEDCIFLSGTVTNCELTHRRRTDRVEGRKGVGSIGSKT